MNVYQRQRGVTLVEVAVATTLVAVVLVASLETLGGAMRTMRETTSQTNAKSLLQQMMAEVLSVSLEDPDGNTSGLGPEADEPSSPTDRLAFDDLDDFDGFTRSPPEDREGVALPGYTGWTQAWTVRYANDEPDGSDALTEAVSDQGLRWVSVEVTDPTGTVTRLDALRSRYGPPEVPVSFDAERITAVQATLIVGGSAEVTRSVSITNQAESP